MGTVIGVRIVRINSNMRVVRGMGIYNSMRIMRIVMNASGGATGFTKECQVCCAGHVCRSEECSRETDNHERVVTAITNVVDDFIFRKETSQWENASECQR